MLSGIGEADHLKSHGIEPIVDLPSVGENLQDHHVAILSLGARGRVGYFGEDRGMRMVKNLVRYLSFQDGPIASSGAETQAFLNLQTPGANPDIQLYCIGVPWPPFGQKSNGISLWANLVRPLSRGRVRLRSANPADEIIYDPNWLSEPEDARRLVEAMKFLRKIAATSPFKEMITEEQLPGSQVTSDEDLDRYVRETTETNYHPVGTCRMGPADDPVAVLTPELRVRGVERLRVMDASMMPEIISANTNATTMAVADRGVDIMMTDHVSAADTNVREPKKIAAII
jgi:choline dehydrogenase-like flavoprotein